MPVKPDHLASSTPHIGAQRKEKRDIASKLYRCAGGTGRHI